MVENRLVYQRERAGRDRVCFQIGQQQKKNSFDFTFSWEKLENVYIYIERETLLFLPDDAVSSVTAVGTVTRVNSNGKEGRDECLHRTDQFGDGRLSPIDWLRYIEFLIPNIFEKSRE